MAEITKLVPRIKFSVRQRHRNLKSPEGPLGRITKIRKSLAALFKYERIELNYGRCNEIRGYAERLISEAVRHGDKHPPTMDMANFWLEDKQMVHKLFKVLAPRYKTYQTPVTEQHLIPLKCHLAFEQKPNLIIQEYVLELRGNPYPPMPQKPVPNSASLTNILLREASKEFKKLKLDSQSSTKTGEKVKEPAVQS